MVNSNQVTSNLTLGAFLERAETKPASEYFDGEIIQKPLPQGEHSILQTRLSTAINQVSEAEKIALALTEIRCTFAGKSIVPDIAVFLWHRIPRTEQGRIVNRFETYPDWIIEILSPEQSPNQVMKKILFCLDQGTQLGWLIDPSDESVMTFHPHQLPSIYDKGKVLPVLGELGDWQLSVNQLFQWLSV